MDILSNNTAYGGRHSDANSNVFGLESIAIYFSWPVFYLCWWFAVQRIGWNEGLFRHDGQGPSQSHDSRRILYFCHRFHRQDVETLAHSSGNVHLAIIHLLFYRFPSYRTVNPNWDANHFGEFWEHLFFWTEIKRHGGDNVVRFDRTRDLTTARDRWGTRPTQPSILLIDFIVRLNAILC